MNVSPPQPTARDMAAIAALVDGSALIDQSRAYEALRLELGRERSRADVAADNERMAREREALYAEWLDNACEDRDAQTRRSRWWMLASWGLFLVLVTVIAWRMQ